MRTGLGLLAAGLLLAGCGGSARPDVVRIETFPVPEGPGLLVAAATAARGVVPLSAIESAIPRSLPANPPQTCKFGPSVQVTLAGGRVMTYGPCERPPAIERLRHALLRAANQQPRHGSVTSLAWKSVLKDWYDGGMNEWHSCAAMREAIRHLPSSPPMYSTVYGDLRAYAEAVC